MHDDPHLGVKGQRVRARHRVRDGNEFDLEGTDATTLAVGDFDEREVVGDLRLGETVSGKAEREGCAVDRDVDVLDEIAQGPGVVFVTVGEDDGVDAIASLEQPAEVREDQVDAVHRRFGEHEPGVDDDDASVLLECETVSSDLAEATEEGDPNVFSHERSSTTTRFRPPRRQVRARSGRGADDSRPR